MDHTTVTAPEGLISRGGKQTHNVFFGKARLMAGLSAYAFMCGMAISTSATAGEWRAIPSLEIAETYTDNVDLDAVDKEYDFVTRISPGISINGQGARMRFNLDYIANFLVFARSDEETDLRHNLNANLHTELVEDWFYLDGRASINQQFLERGGSISSNTDNVTDNRQTIQNYSISPSIRRPIGTFGTVTAMYSLGYIKTGRPDNPILVPIDIMQETVTHRGLLSLDSGRQFTRFRWSISADYTRDNRKNAFRDSERSSIRFNGDYAVNSWLRLVGSLGYEENDDSTFFTNKNDGLTWDAGVTLTPGPRSILTVRGGRRYGDDNWSVKGSYQLSERSVIDISYSEEVTTSQRILQNGLFDDPNNPVIDPGGFSLTDSAFFRKRYSIGLTGSRGRNTVSGQAFYEERTYRIATRDEDNYGGSLNFSRSLSRKTSFSLGGSYQHTKYDSGARTDNFYSGQVALNHSLSEYISGGITYFYTNRSSTFNLRDLEENAVRLSVKATF